MKKFCGPHKFQNCTASRASYKIIHWATEFITSGAYARIRIGIFLQKLSMEIFVFITEVLFVLFFFRQPVRQLVFFPKKFYANQGCPFHEDKVGT